jgi:hypothetical protein
MQKVLAFTVLLLLFGTNVYTEDLKFTKIVDLDEPWGSSFISDNEMIITEKKWKNKNY